MVDLREYRPGKVIGSTFKPLEGKELEITLSRYHNYLHKKKIPHIHVDGTPNTFKEFGGDYDKSF
jgi:hypothetical protein